MRDIAYPVINNAIYTRSFIKTPSAETVAHQRKMLGQFHEVWNLVSGRISEDTSTWTELQKKVKKGTYLRVLQSPLYAAHPDINAGYFDEISDAGVVLVKDSISGKMLPKAECSLTTDGKFVKTQNTDTVKFSEDRGRFDDDTNNELYRVLVPGTCSAGDREVYKARLAKKTLYLFIDEINLYLKVSVADLGAAISPTQIAGAINHHWINFATRRAAPAVQNGEEFPQVVYESFKTSFATNFTGLAPHNSFILMVKPVDVPIDPANVAQRTTTIPPDADFFRGCEIYHSANEQGLFVNGNPNSWAFRLSHTNGDRPQLVSPGTTPPERWATYQRQNVPIEALGTAVNFPMRIYIQVRNPGRATGRTESVPTDNNLGRVMGYNTRVPDYKASFRMTKEEEEHYKHYKGKKSPTFLGIELEYQIKKPLDPSKSKQSFNTQTIKDIAESPFGDHCLMKHDGSIGDIGFELVTIPGTMDYHKQMFDEHFFKLKFNNRLFCAPSCGLHVHIDKAAFKEFGTKATSSTADATFRMRMGKFIAFMGSPDNYNFIKDIAGRGENLYCRPNQVKKTNKHGVATGASIGNAMKATAGTTVYDRRSIVNVQNNATIEIRIFKSTNDRNNLFRKLEFCHALVDFVRTASLRELTVYHFISFVIDKDNVKQYPCLARWLAVKRYVGLEQRRSKITGKVSRTYGPVKLENPLDKIKSNVVEDKPAKAKKKIAAEVELDRALNELVHGVTLGEMQLVQAGNGGRNLLGNHQTFTATGGLIGGLFD